MSAGTFSAFAMSAQAAGDALLAHLQREQPEAAERIAQAVAAGDLVLSVAMTIGAGSASVELLTREPGRTTSVCSVPLKIGQPSKAN